MAFSRILRYNKENRKKTRKFIGILYDKRSRILHDGELKVTNDDLFLIRQISRHLLHFYSQIYKHFKSLEELKDVLKVVDLINFLFGKLK